MIRSGAFALFVELRPQTVKGKKKKPSFRTRKQQNRTEASKTKKSGQAWKPKGALVIDTIAPQLNLPERIDVVYSCIEAGMH